MPRGRGGRGGCYPPWVSLPPRLGPYAILERLGVGGMAEVHLARRFGASGWEKLVALKTLRPERRGEPELERMLVTEARLGAMFAHPGLIGVHDLGLADGVYYLCMDYVDGADLAALLAADPEPIPAPLALLIAEQLAATLAYVHALTDASGRPLGLVHRDLSPANLLCSRAGELKLGDFGIAKATAEAERTWGRIRKGKYAYMAPEQITGEPITAAADLFALGVTLHECLLGRRPFDRATSNPGFEGDSPLALMEAVRIAHLPSDHDFGDLDADLVVLLRRCLARAPADRPSATELVAALQAARRRVPPVGILDLAGWVRARLSERDAGSSGIRSTRETVEFGP
jgi:eukaryotic-like serine/threonine-protein kinase